MATYYPPQIEGKIPAQYGSVLRIPFKIGFAPSQNKTLQARIKQIVSNNIVGDILKSQNDLSKASIAEFAITDTLLTPGQHYKIQLSWDGDIYSTVGIFRYTHTPKVELKGCDATKVNLHQNEYVATYSNEDAGERPYQYRFILAQNSKMVESSGLIDYEYNSDSTIAYRFKTAIDANALYSIQCIVYTTGGLEVRSPSYLIQNYNEYVPYMQAKIKAVAHPSNGSISVTIEPPEDHILRGQYRIFRTSELTNFNIWDELANIEININSPWEIFQDKTVQQGIKYKYAIQQYDDETNVYTIKIETDSIVCDFEDAFLFDGQRQLKIKYNPKISSFKTVNQEQKIDTIGSPYPFIFRNGYTSYKEFPISGLISLLMDDNQDFSQVKASESIFSFATDLTGANIANEREFKLDVLNWLTDGKVKLFRSPSEGNYIVRLMNTSLAPNDTLGRMLHTFSTTAYEVAPFSYSSLLEYGLIEKISNNLGVLNYRVYHSIDYRGETTLSFNYGKILTIRDATPGATFIIETSLGEKLNIQIGRTGYYQYITDGEIYITHLTFNPKYLSTIEIGQYGQVSYPILDEFIFEDNKVLGKIYKYDFGEKFTQFQGGMIYSKNGTSSIADSGFIKQENIVKINLLQIESRTDVTTPNPADMQMIIKKDKGNSEEIIDFGPQNKQNNQWTSGRIIYTPDISDIESISIGNGLIAYMYYTVQMTEYESVNGYDV